MEEEIWKPVEELPEKYLVSNLGRIKYIGGYRGVADRIIQSCDKNGKGYYRVNMWDSKNKKNIPRSVHFLVARAFVDNPNHYTVINHKDENPANNRADNLEWCTYKYNNEYGTARERASKTRSEKGISKKVFVYNKDGSLVNTFDSVFAASKYYKIHSANISACCNRKGSYKTQKGLIFRFEGDTWEYEILKYGMNFEVYLNNTLVLKAKGAPEVSRFLNIPLGTLRSKIRRYRLKGKPMIHKDYKIFILEEK